MNIDKDKLSKIIKATIKEVTAKSDIMRHQQKFKHFSDGEKDMLKNCIEDAWSRGKIKDKAMARYMLKGLGSDVAEGEE